MVEISKKRGVSLGSYLLLGSRSILLAAAIGIAASASAATLNLSNVTTNTTIADGTTLTGVLNERVKLSIANGATVNLLNVQIVFTARNESPWAGLTCEGDATIVLPNGSTNIIYSCCNGYPGILPAVGYTLTIRGDGELSAVARGNAAGIGSGYPSRGDVVNAGNIVIEGGDIRASSEGFGAGIGGSPYGYCGNITISGGTITARSGAGAAGIGSSIAGSHCGNILISGGRISADGSNGGAGIGSGNAGICGSVVIAGGTVNALGSTYAAAIGSGSDQKSVCGAVIVKPGIVSVTARKPDNAGELIGAGSDGVCHGVFLDEAILVDDHDNYRTLSSRAVNLANITEATTIADGKIITGTLVANVKVSIADGATVTLRSATINGVNNSSYSWAGITCLGDATIILEGDNNVTGFYENYPGIHIPEGHTLTIKGDGLLNASGNVRNNRRWAAGIGGGYDVNCGNIRIEGGTITAAGGSGAANIGGGMRGTCGSITITKGVTCVTATEDSNASCSIGRGRNGTVGTVTIGGVVGEITENPYTYMPNLDLTSVTADTTLASGMTVTGTLAANVKVSIADGATVTLRDVTINAGTSEWAGLTCLGDATIILEGSNSVSGYDTYPGIHVPSDYTLTIKGDGSLTARAGTHSSTDRAAGIGGGWGKSCGNIVIDGGEIDAIGGMRAAGIGGGFQGSFGDITISRRVTRVTATKGTYGVYSIGPGQSGSCGTVTIGGEEGEIAESPYTYVPTKVNLAAQSGDYTATDGDMLYGETAHTVTIAAGATVTINGVEVTGAEGGTVLPSPTFSAGGKAATTEFVRGANGKWTLTTFAEMSNDALGKDVPNNQIKVYSANTVEGLNSASPMTSGVTVKEKKSAVKATIEVTPPSGAQRQFFKVKIGE